MRKTLTILLILFSFWATAQEGWNSLAFRKSFHDQLDDCLFRYERFGVLDNEIRQERFLDLFTDSAHVEDYINPILQKKKAIYQNKPIKTFINDFIADFPTGFNEFQVTDIDYQNLDIRRIDLSKRVFTLKIIQQDRAQKGEGDFFESSPELQFQFVFDTTSNEVVNLRINEIDILKANLALEKKVTTKQVRKSYEFGASVSYPIVGAQSTNLIQTDESLSAILNEEAINRSELKWKGEEIISFGASQISILKIPEGREFSLSLGAYIERARYTLSVPIFQSAFNDTDPENEPFLHIVEGRGIKEVLLIDALRIPSRARFEYQLTNSGIGFFVHGGFDIVWRFRANYSVLEGELVHSGFYPQYGSFIVEGATDLGLTSDRTDNLEGQYSFLKKVDFPVNFSAGLSFRLGHESPWHLYTAIGLNGSLMNFSAFDENHLPTRGTGEYEGLAPWLNKINFGSANVNLTLRRKFKIKINKL